MYKCTFIPCTRSKSIASLRRPLLLSFTCSPLSGCLTSTLWSKWWLCRPETRGRRKRPSTTSLIALKLWVTINQGRYASAIVSGSRRDIWRTDSTVRLSIGLDRFFFSLALRVFILNLSFNKRRLFHVCTILSLIAFGLGRKNTPMITFLISTNRNSSTNLKLPKNEKLFSF